MKKNVGPMESKLRIAGGIGAGLLSFTVRSRLLSSALAAVALSGIESGLTKYCPINEALGIDNAHALKKA